MTTSSTSVPDPFPVPAGRRAMGQVQVPSSKSVTHRYLNLTLLAGTEALIERPLLAEDTRLFLAALERCGLAVEQAGSQVRIAPGGGRAPGGQIFCGNAGTMYRFLVASLSTLPGQWQLDGIARLRERPIRPLVDALRQLGAEIGYLVEEGFAPLSIRGGSLAGGRTTLAAGESSQYLSALLMAGLRAPAPIEIEVASLTSTPYVALTLDAIRAFGGAVEVAGSSYRVAPTALRAGRLRVEGDFSAAAYPAAAAALTGGRVLLRGLDRASSQGDRRFLEVLTRMGAEVRWTAEGAEVCGGGELVALEADLSDMPDQVPTLAALAPFARGRSRVFNVSHLRVKESDRLAAMAQELRRVGAAVEERADGLDIPGIWAEARPPGGRVVIDPHGDHRIAMSLSVTGLKRPGIEIGAPHVVGKSYPDYWRDFESLLAG